MKRHLSSIVGILLFSLAACGTLDSKKEFKAMKIAWAFDIQTDAGGLPRGSVFLLVDNERVLVHPNVEMGYKLIAAEDFAQHKIPVHAVAACTTYGAGRGEELYVVREKKQLVVFGRLLDEEGSGSEFKVRLNIPIK